MCDYSGTCILVNGSITITWSEGTRDEAARLATRYAVKRNKEVIFENCSPFTNCIIIPK